MKTQISAKIKPQPSNTLKKVYESLLPSGLAFLRDKWGYASSPVWLFDLATWNEILSKKYEASGLSRNKKHWFLVEKDKFHNKISWFLVVKEDWTIIDFFDWFDLAKNLWNNKIDNLWIVWDTAYILRHNFDKNWKIEWTSIYSKNIITSVINEQFFKWKQLKITNDFRLSSYDWTVFVAVDQNGWKEIFLDHALTPIVLPQQFPGGQSNRKYSPITLTRLTHPIIWEKTIWLQSINPSNWKEEQYLYEYTWGRCLIWPYDHINWMHEGKAVVCTDSKTLVVDKWDKKLFEIDWVYMDEAHFEDWFVLINWDLYNEKWEKTTFPYIKNSSGPEYLWVEDWLFHFVVRNNWQQRVSVFTDFNWNPVSENIASLYAAQSNIRVHKIKDHIIRVSKSDTSEPDTIDIFKDSNLFCDVQNLGNWLFEVDTNWFVIDNVENGSLEVKKDTKKRKYYSGSNKNIEYKSIEELIEKSKLVNETEDFLEIWGKKFKKSLTKGFKLK